MRYGLALGAIALLAGAACSDTAVAVGLTAEFLGPGNVGGLPIRRYSRMPCGLRGSDSHVICGRQSEFR
jgi:hypothetical protein